jgi:Spy/CpxP family protein refolding chaperone
MKIRSTLAVVGLSIAAVAATGCANDASAEEQYSAETQKAYELVSTRVDHALGEIDADDSQRDQVHAIKDRLFESARGVREQGRDTRVEVLEQFGKEKPDAERVHALIDERLEAHRKLMHQLADGMIELHGVLTPEQRNELLSRVEERMASRGAL